MDPCYPISVQRLLNTYGNYHPHTLQHIIQDSLQNMNIEEYVNFIRLCPNKRCKQEYILSHCINLKCKISRCNECNRTLIEIRNVGWKLAFDRMHNIGLPPRWLIPQLRIGESDYIIAAAIAELGINEFVKQIGSEIELETDIVRSTIYDDTEIQILNNGNICCIHHSRDEIKGFVITSSIFKYINDWFDKCPYITKFIDYIMINKKSTLSAQSVWEFTGTYTNYDIIDKNNATGYAKYWFNKCQSNTTFMEYITNDKIIDKITTKTQQHYSHLISLESIINCKIPLCKCYREKCVHCDKHAYIVSTCQECIDISDYWYVKINLNNTSLNDTPLMKSYIREEYIKNTTYKLARIMRSKSSEQI